MTSFKKTLNDMLMQVYHNILRVEEEFLQKNHRVNLTIREMHLIECVGTDKENGKTLSEIADYLKVARPSVTVAVNKLVRRGYLVKNGSDRDGRVVHVTLTREGRKVYLYHNRYHMSMIDEIENELGEEERAVLIRVIAKLNKFFERSVGAAT